MGTVRAKIIAIVIFATALLLLAVFRSTPAMGAAITFDEPAAVYKAKCAMCHLPAATKFFDPAKADEEHVQIILNGKKGEKPPFMPGYKEKGMTEDEAKGLVTYMKGLRKAS